MSRYKLVEIDPKTNHKSREIIRFDADDDNGAEQYRKAYLIEKDSTANPDLVKWERCTPSTTVHDDGTKTFHEDLFDDIGKSSFKEKIADFFEKWLVDKPKAWLRKRRSKKFLLKNEYPKWAEWSLDDYLLKIMKSILPKLASDSHGVNNSFIVAAAKELFGDSWREKLDEIERSYGSDDANDLEKQRKLDERAVSIMKNVYNEIVLHIKLYDFYSSYGSTDDIEFDKKWMHTLPQEEGSNRQFTSEGYKKIDSMAMEHWNKIWDMVKEHGQTFWD